MAHRGPPDTPSGVRRPGGPRPGPADLKRRHSDHLERALQRARHQPHAGWNLDAEDVEAAVDGGETIEEYDDGSRLVLGRGGVRPVHAVVAEDQAAGVRIVVTVYEPDLTRWEPGFRERRSR